MRNVNPFRPQWAMFAIAVVLAVATFVGIAFMPRSQEVRGVPDTPDDLKITSVTVLRPEVASAIDFAGLGWVVVLIALTVHALRCRAYARMSVAAVAALLGLLSPVATFLREPAPWQVYGEARAADGTVYCFAESSFLQGQTLILARVREEATFTRTLEPLVVTNGDSPRSYLLVVRPADIADRYGQVHLSEGRWVLGLRSANPCYFAYDRGAGRGYGGKAVEQLSPFLPLGAADDLHKSDVEMVGSAVAERRKGAPTPEAIREGQDHPNPHTREVASRLLDAMR